MGALVESRIHGALQRWIRARYMLRVSAYTTDRDTIYFDRRVLAEHQICSKSELYSR